MSAISDADSSGPGPSPTVISRRRIVKAVYVGGVLRPEEPLPLPEGAELDITVWPTLPAREKGPKTGTHAAADATTDEKGSRGGRPSAPTARHFAAWILFGLAMLVYAFTRLWEITRFPIYFFTDEAANPLFAESLIANGFKNAQGILFPIYFEVAGNRWGPSSRSISMR